MTTDNNQLLNKLKALDPNVYTVRVQESILDDILTSARTRMIHWSVERSDPIYMYSDSFAQYLADYDEDISDALLNATLLASGSALDLVAARSGIFRETGWTDDQLRLAVLLARVAQSGVTTEAQIIANTIIAGGHYTAAEASGSNAYLGVGNPKVLSATPQMMSDGAINIYVVKSDSYTVSLDGTDIAEIDTYMNDIDRANVGQRFYPQRLSPGNAVYEIVANIQYLGSQTSDLPNFKAQVFAAAANFAYLSRIPGTIIRRSAITTALSLAGVQNVDLVTPATDLARTAADLAAITWPRSQQPFLPPNATNAEKATAVQRATVYTCLSHPSFQEERTSAAQARTAGKYISLYFEDVG